MKSISVSLQIPFQICSIATYKGHGSDKDLGITSFKEFLKCLRSFFLLKLMVYASKSTKMKVKKQPMGSHIDCKMLIANGSSIPGNHIV